MSSSVVAPRRDAGGARRPVLSHRSLLRRRLRPLRGRQQERRGLRHRRDVQRLEGGRRLHRRRRLSRSTTRASGSRGTRTRTGRRASEPRCGLGENLVVTSLIDVKRGGDMWNGTKGALYYFGAHRDTEPYHGEGATVVFGQSNPGAESNSTLAHERVAGPGAGKAGSGRRDLLLRQHRERLHGAGQPVHRGRGLREAQERLGLLHPRRPGLPGPHRTFGARSSP